MYVKSLIFAILLCIVPTLVKAQTYVYSYADPCTGILKTINVPTNGVTVTYFGQMNTFNPADFTNGNFNNWANGVYSSFGGNNPCGSTIGISTSVSMAQNTAMNVLGIMNTLDALSSISGGGLNTNGVTESSKTESKSSNKKNNKKNNSDGSTTGGTTEGSGSTGGTTGSNGSTTGGTNGSATSGGTTEGSGSTGGTTGSNGSTTSGGTTGTNGSTTTGGTTTGSNGSTAGGTTGSNGSTTSGGTTEGSGSTTTGGTTTGSNGSTAGGTTTGSNGSTAGGTTTGSNGSTAGGTTGGTTGSNGSTTSGGTTGSNGSTTTGGTTGSNGSTTTGGTTTGSNGSTAGGTTEGSGSTTTGGTTEGSGSTTAGGTTGSNGSTTAGGTTGSNGSTTTGGSGSGSTPNNNSTGSDAATNEEKKSSNILGGSIGSIQNATSTSTTSSKGGSSPTKGNAPTIVLSSDFAGFNFKSGDATYGGKGTAGWTSLNWDGTRSHGFMLDYTSANKGPNFTAFYASIKKRRIDLISVTGTTSFYGKGSLYGTVALGQMWSFPKVKNLKAIYMATSSYGNVYGTKFIGTAFIAGGMYDFKIGKRTQIKLTNLFIYAPYISYYNDMVLKSPYVIMPIIGTNIGVTKKFKLNVNFGGTYALGENVLNFTVMMGTRFAL